MAMSETELAERKYPTLRKATNHRGLQMDLVRWELYLLLRKQQRVRQFHVDSWEANGDHLNPCGICMRFHSEIEGIKHAIRHFGGNPR